MPLYEYKCSTCGKVFETIQKFSDAPLEVHDDCGGRLEKLISVSALQFKGSGWYVNDYARGSVKSEGSEKKAESEKKSDTASDKKSEKKSETASESKPAETKTESKPAAPVKTGSDS
jgi:putative FmdB family regulatory protein